MESEEGPGACTSMVAEDESRQVFHGRNLDWNLPPQMRQFILDIEFQKGGRTQFIGTVLLGGTGLMAGMKPGGFTFSNDARCEGGKLLENLATALLTGAQTPSHHARRVFDQAGTFDEAVKLFSTGDLIDEVYYIVGGAAPGEGAIITRDRLNTADICGWEAWTRTDGSGCRRTMTTGSNRPPLTIGARLVMRTWLLSGSGAWVRMDCWACSRHGRTSTITPTTHRSCQPKRASTTPRFGWEMAAAAAEAAAGECIETQTTYTQA